MIPLEKLITDPFSFPEEQWGREKYHDFVCNGIHLCITLQKKSIELNHVFWMLSFSTGGNPANRRSFPAGGFSLTAKRIAKIPYSNGIRPKDVDPMNREAALHLLRESLHQSIGTPAHERLQFCKEIIACCLAAKGLKNQATVYTEDMVVWQRVEENTKKYQQKYQQIDVNFQHFDIERFLDPIRIIVFPKYYSNDFHTILVDIPNTAHELMEMRQRVETKARQYGIHAERYIDQTA